MIEYWYIVVGSLGGVKVKGISVNYVSFITLFAIATAILCAQRGHTLESILAYFTFVFIVTYVVHRR